jgi:hypothetical protein
VNALRYQPLKRAEIARRRINMRGQAMMRVMTLNTMWPSPLLEWLRDGDLREGTPEWHERQARMLRDKQEHREALKKANELRSEDANTAGLLTISQLPLPHHFMAGPSGRLPK